MPDKDCVIDLFKEPAYRPSLIEQKKVRSSKERRSLQKQIEKNKKDHETILTIEKFDLTKKLLKRDLAFIEKIKQAKNKKRLLLIIENDNKYHSSLKNKLHEICAINHNKIISNSSTSIVTSKDIKPKSLSELRREILNNKHITPLEKNIALVNLSAISQDNVPIFEMLNLHFLLKEVFNIWIESPTTLKNLGVAIKPVLFYEQGYTNDYYIVSIMKSNKKLYNSYFHKIFEIFDTRNIKKEKACLRTKVDIISRILDINTIQKVYNLTKEFLNSIGIESSSAHFKNLKTAYLTNISCEEELKTSIARFIEYNDTDDCDKNRETIKELFESVLDNSEVEKSFFFLVNPKFFKDTKDDYFNVSLKKEWTEKLSYEQLSSIENYIKHELPTLSLPPQKREYIGCKNTMIDEIFVELRFTKKQFNTVINKLFADITYMSTYKEINLKEFINIEVDKVVSEEEKLRSREKLTKVKKLVQVCITFFLKHLTSKGYALKVADNCIIKTKAIEYVV